MAGRRSDPDTVICGGAAAEEEEEDPPSHMFMFPSLLLHIQTQTHYVKTSHVADRCLLCNQPLRPACNTIRRVFTQGRLDVGHPEKTEEEEEEEEEEEVLHNPELL